MKENTTHSAFWGIMVIAGTVVGGGMFALPVDLAGAWFFWGAFILLVTCFFMIHSGLLFLEANLNYPVGSSFDTITKDLLGKKWNFINNFSVAFVLYILVYAYISANSAIIGETIFQNFTTTVNAKLLGIVIATFVASILWFSSNAASKVTSFFIGLKIIAFIVAFGSLFFHVDYSILTDAHEELTMGSSYFPYIFMALPVCLTSFGFHENIPSLVISYGKNKKTLILCIVLGASIALLIYVFWLYCTMGNITRNEFKSIIFAGGNVDSLVSVFIGNNSSRLIDFFLLLFSNLAVASSFFGVSLGLFDFLADLLKFDNSHLGRLKTIATAFIPPLLLYILFPNGFLYGIGAAGLFATIWTLITPSLLAVKSREKFKDQSFTVWGGRALPFATFIFAVLVICCWFGNFFALIPKFS